MDSQNSRDAAGNGGRLGIHDDLQAEDAMEEIDDDFVDPLHTRVAHHSKAAPSKPKRQSDRLATEYNDDFDDDIEEIIVIEPDRGPSRANRRIRRIYKRGPARQIHPFPREEQVDDHDWGPMSLPEWLGKMPTSEYVDEYEGDANRHRPRKESVRKIGVETDSTNRRVIIRKYKGGGSLPGDRLVNESHVKGWREFADEDEELEQADRVEYSRRTIRERPRHRYRERGRALTRASFRLPEDSEDDLIDFDRVLEESSDHDTTNNNGINKNRNRGNNSVTHRDTLKGMSHNLSNITKADVGVGSGAIDGGEADVEDEVEKDGEVPREKRLKNLKHQKGVEVGDEMTDLLTFEAPVKHSIASSQTIETDNKFTQTQSNIPSANSDLVEDQDNKGTADATSGEFEFAFNSDHSPKDSSGSGGGESNATPRAGDSVQTETKPALPEKVKHDKKEKLPSKSNKSMKPKSESRYMDWYNKNGEKGLTKHKAHCEMTHHHHMNSHLQQESLLSQSSNDGENIADETKVPRRRDSDPLANDRHQRRIMATNTRTPGDKKRNDTVLDAMENEIRLGGNPFVAEDDEDSGIGQTDSFKSSKKQFLEKQSLFTIAYNGMQNKQDALKDREPSAPAHRVS